MPDLVLEDAELAQEVKRAECVSSPNFASYVQLKTASQQNSSNLLTNLSSDELEAESFYPALKVDQKNASDETEAETTDCPSLIENRPPSSCIKAKTGSSAESYLARN